MSRSRRKNWNVVNAASLARWLVLTVFLALTGLSYVYLTLQLYHLGERKKALENELAGLRTQSDLTRGVGAPRQGRLSAACPHLRA